MKGINAITLSISEITWFSRSIAINGENMNNEIEMIKLIMICNDHALLTISSLMLGVFIMYCRIPNTHKDMNRNIIIVAKAAIPKSFGDKTLTNISVLAIPIIPMMEPTNRRLAMGFRPGCYCIVDES